MKRKIAPLKMVDPARTAIAYFLFGSLWIIVSDALLAGSLKPGLGTAKGLAFILVTALLLYWFLKRESQASLPLQLAFHHGPFGIAFFNADGTLITCTPVFSQIFDGGFELFESAELHSLLVRLSALPTGEVRQVDRVIDAGNGATRHIVITFINSSDGPGGFVCIAEDVTRQHQLERELHQLEASLRDVQKMEILGQVAGGAAHDFNNHLQILGGYAELLAEEEDPEARYELLEEMKRSVEQASALSHKLLTFARRQKSNPVTVDVRDICREATSFVSAAFPREIMLNVDICEEPLVMEADKDEVGRVLANLCLNARDAIDGVGKVMVSVSRLVVTDNGGDMAPGAYAKIEVADTGCGMDETLVKNIFAPFFTTKGERGTGLGLATSHGIVKQHKGVIKVDSFPRRGSTFTVCLPLRDAVDMNLVLGHERDVATVLLAEKDPEILVITSRLLSKSGYNVIGTRGMDETREVFDRHAAQIDVVVMDLDARLVSGGQVYEYIRNVRHDMPIIFSRKYFVDEARNPPPDVLRINSPSSPDVLKAAIEVALDRDPPELRTGT